MQIVFKNLPDMKNVVDKFINQITNNINAFLDKKYIKIIDNVENKDLFSEKLIDLARLCDNILSVKDLFNNILNKCIEYYKDKRNYEDMFDLFNLL